MPFFTAPHADITGFNSKTLFFQSSTLTHVVIIDLTKTNRVLETKALKYMSCNVQPNIQ